MFIILALVTLAATGMLYVCYPTYVHAARERRRAAAQRALQEAQARQQEQQKADQALHDAVRSDPENTLLPRVAAAVNPVEIQANAAEAEAMVTQAQKKVTEATNSLTEQQNTAPAWWHRPVLRILAFGGLALFPVSYFVGIVFDYLMLSPITSPFVAVLLAVVIPTLLLVGTALFSVGMGWHGADRPTAVQRAMQFGGAVLIIGILAVLWQLAPQRTAEGHRTSIARAEATYTQQQARRTDAPQDVPQSSVDLARQNLDAARAANELDAKMQSIFSLGIATGEIILGEAALLGLAILPIPLGQRKLRRLAENLRQAQEQQRQVQTRTAARIQQVALETIDFLRAHGVPDPRGMTLRILADLRLIPVARETVMLNLGEPLDDPAIEAPPEDEPPYQGPEEQYGHPLLDDMRDDDDYDVVA